MKKRFDDEDLDLEEERYFSDSYNEEDETYDDKEYGNDFISWDEDGEEDFEDEDDEDEFSDGFSFDAEHLVCTVLDQVPRLVVLNVKTDPPAFWHDAFRDSHGLHLFFCEHHGFHQLSFQAL